ncbi:unnamed protein product [Coccothraustes coccothraustes]
MGSPAPRSRGGRPARRLHAFYDERRSIVLGHGGSLNANGRGRQARAPLRGGGTGSAPLVGRKEGESKLRVRRSPSAPAALPQPARIRLHLTPPPACTLVIGKGSRHA